jgi:hypothetical protein
VGERSLWEREVESSILSIPTIMDIKTVLHECSDLLDELDAALASAEEAVTVTDLKDIEARMVVVSARM